MIKIIFTLLVQIPFIMFAQGKLQFIGEKIDFSINDSLFNVNGIYIFVNSTKDEIKQKIFFPLNQGVDSFNVKRVFNLSNNQFLPFQQKINGISFLLIVPPKDTTYLNISYSQNTYSENIYLFESTQTWDTPLKFAEYSLRWDDSVIIDSLSYKPDSIVNNVCYWSKENFYPKENFKIMIR